MTGADTSSRGRVDLDGTWRFIPDPERMYGPDALPDGEAIAVPGCWEAQVARPYGIVSAWYRRPLLIPAGWDGQRVVLHFQAVMYRCAVFIDGQHIGGHEGGYTPFEVEATGVVRAGMEHDLAVYVVNPLNALDEYPAFSVEEPYSDMSETELPLAEAPHGKQTWYSSQSGIWLSVRAEARPKVALGAPRLRADLAAGAVVVRWTLDPGGDQDIPDGATLRIEVADGDRTTVATRDLPNAELAAMPEVAVTIPEPRLWDLDDPHLYRVTLRLLDRDGSELDAVNDRFGMREVRTEGGRVILNGRPVFLVGVLDQDLYPTSISTPPDRAYLDEQMRLVRQMGINLLRCHIKVPDPAYLEAADEAGILVWCELPNWSTLTSRSAQRGRATLGAMVDAMGNHPSIIIWTIINEDWGTDLRHEARDRRWLREMVADMRELDPTRLVVDNSACETFTTPNFHLDTDLADFHVYFLAPDNAVRWRNQIEDFAKRPRWLWSPHGDIAEDGDEPLILSEFGSWGLPRLDRLIAHTGREPWWFATGRQYYRPSGMRRRFEAYGLERLWPTVEALAEATQWHQFEAMQYEIGQLRRHDAISGYVYTELTDAYWEANGLLDAMRGPKVYHDRLPSILSPDVIHADIPRRDLFAGEVLRADLSLAAYGARSQDGEVRWGLEVDGQTIDEGTVSTGPWPEAGTRPIGGLEITMPDVATTTDASLRLEAFDASGAIRARDDLRLALLPAAAKRTSASLRVAAHDPFDIWGISDRLRGLGHDLVPPAEAELIVASDLTPDVVDHIEAGGRALVLVRGRAAIPADHDLARRVNVHLRRLPHSGWPGQRSPWEGDWVTSWSWILPEILGQSPVRAPLDFAYEEVLPDHVLLGHDPMRHRDEVTAGMFVGWVHAPAALIWSFRQGAGAVTLTTFRVSPERGPVATALLEALIQHAARTDRRGQTGDRRETLEDVRVGA
ncbi:MAG TPA: glycoside hydrolase family 2 TIM barrel-domain containing protein [Candidatus Saccharimonadales bacterium]|nr:glycoside hydrolase family 2 TIM barrel-domain containing protein [Candidatus Saccharimonadales bacterium]